MVAMNFPSETEIVFHPKQKISIFDRFKTARPDYLFVASFMSIYIILYAILK